MTTPTPTPDPAALRTFGQFLQQVQDGNLHGEVSKELQDLIASLNNIRAEQGGEPKGRITLTFDFTLADGLIEVVADYAVKSPRLKRSKSHFWTTPDNMLTRRNPRQLDMEFRSVPPRAADEAVRTA